MARGSPSGLLWMFTDEVGGSGNATSGAAFCFLTHHTASESWGMSVEVLPSAGLSLQTPAALAIS